MRRTRILGREAMTQIVASVGLDLLLDELIERMANIIESLDDEKLKTFDRSGFHYSKPDLGLIEWMPAMDLGRVVSIKTVGYHPSNPVERGAPSVVASTTLHDTTSGHLIALCDATFTTALRTGAASALATDILAVTDSTTLGMIGCGAQAVTQIHAELGADLTTLVKERDAYLEARGRLTVYDSTGWALQDLVVAELFLDNAGRIGAGVDIELQPTPRDPYDPYKFVLS